DKIREIYPAARFVQADPAIHITVSPTKPHFAQHAENFRQAQFHALDMLVGKRAPELGGAEKYLDIIGVNFYSQNQWRHPSGRRVMRGNKNYRPFSQILQEWFERYRRPIYIAETGIEDDARADWFRYICKETRIAAEHGVQIVGICLYPIVNHPGWDDNRHCHNGLWDYPNGSGEREIYAPLAEELKEQQTAQELFEIRKIRQVNA
ncbi:MAG: beta-glucosidase, partial [Acidobacteriota bacterium]